MDNEDTPFHAPVSVAVGLRDLDAAVHDGIITEQQAQALWTRWVAAPARLGENTHPMPLREQADGLQEEPARGFAKVRQYLRALVRR